VQHILSNCVFTRQFWHNILTPIGFSIVAPKRRDSCFAEWWRKASARIPKSKRKGFNSVVILGAWSLWKQRNRCIFYGARPCLSTSEDGFKDEMWLWFFCRSQEHALSFLSWLEEGFLASLYAVVVVCCV
jgi:hypothetical protein